MTKITRASIGYSASFVCILLGLATKTYAGAPASSDVFRDLISKRLYAHVSGDVVGYRRLIADDFVHVDDAGHRRTAVEMESYNRGGNNAHWELGELHSRRIGEFAIVDCEVTEIVPFVPRELRFPYHETDVFVMRRGNWLFLQHAETRTLTQPTPVMPDISVLDTYVGRYEWWPGYSETFTRRGDKLFVQAPGDMSPTPLRAASNESFFVDGAPDLLVFVRDANGKITHEILHSADGQVFIARKVMGEY